MIKTKLWLCFVFFFVFLLFFKFFKVLVEDKLAVGVEMIKEGRKHVIKSKKEVILSAGSIGSAHILLLSGIGPQKQLVKHHVRGLL